MITILLTCPSFLGIDIFYILLYKSNITEIDFRIICTDALARGIDIDDIDVVISYDMPRHINTYIHRIGRTGRAGNRGTSITMLIDEERKKFNVI